MPENYELWFVYYAQSDPELTKTVDALLEKNNGKLSNEQCYKIFHDFLSGQREAKTVRHAGDQVRKAINNVNDAVVSAKQRTKKYNQNLKSVNTKLQEENTKRRNQRFGIRRPIQNR